MDNMDVDTDDDPIVKQIDIYSSNTLEHQLALFQFPLRPPWRPYDMSELTEVRFKHRLGKVEMDFPPNNTPQFSNDDNPLKPSKFTLTSNQIQLRTNFAVGVVRGEELHLTPIHNVIQLRPSFEHIDKIDEENKKNAKKDEKEDDETAVSSRTNEDVEEDLKGTGIKPIQVQFKRKEIPGRTAPARVSHAQILKAEATEPWTKLYFYNDPKSLSNEPTLAPVNTNDKMETTPSNTTSSSSSSSTTTQNAPPPPIIPRFPPMFTPPYFDKLLCKEEFRENNINGKLTPDRYLELMCMSSAAIPSDDNSALRPRIPGNIKAGLSLDELKKLALDKQIETIMVTGHVVSFSRICELATRTTDQEEILKHLEKIAYFMDNRWVIKSERVCKEPASIYRDYILFSICNNKYIKKHKVAEDLRILTEDVKELLSYFAKFVPTEGWTWKIDEDIGFLTSYPKHAESLKNQWEAKKKTIPQSLQKHLKDSKQIREFVETKAAQVKSINTNSNNNNNNAPVLASNDTISAQQIKEILVNVFAKEGVCSREHLLKELVKAAPKLSPEGKRAAESTFNQVLKEIAGDLHHTHYLKTLGNEPLDKIRDVVIGKFSTKGVAVKRSEIIETINAQLRTTVPQDVLSTILGELTTLVKGGMQVWKIPK
eukprot:TRINITY_DN1669_c0_g1_i3.p1 TRINITY_DN1669_c0_g1~~TRINITY_DN1669_c0_g1_i3.p1  ORF type:complete len:653 (-),score=123.96 TRINITY_DN1669_c0_g1_i3:176-2134(-)